MIRHVVIGTAGHVDHGKTALVKALTGVNTDRFPEEQRRGITIDIGFAPLELGAGLHASIVDVPGHEDFIRNMVAGATGIDVALLVVAADEGIMPQTIEHLAILELLGVPAGAVAITKSDLADPDWLELVRSDVADRLRDTPIAWEAPVAVSAVTGSGVDELRRRLAAVASGAALRAANDLFRMPVDRVFSLPGAGTVITGTTWTGTVKAGESVTILPEAVTARARSIEVHGERRDAAEPGRRTAIALAGLERAAASRGSVAVADSSWRATSVLDVVLSLLPSAPRPVTQRTRVRFHLGTAEIIARVTPAHETIEPGHSGVARLRLEEPVVARWGDRGVIRAYSPVTTVGGCTVMDPWPPARPRRPLDDLRRASADPVERVRAFVLAGDPGGVLITELTVRAGIPAGSVQQVVRGALETTEIVRLGDRLVAGSLVESLRARALEAVATEHRASPLSAGMPLEILRQKLRPAEIGAMVLEQLMAAGEIVAEGGTARLRGHAAVLGPDQEAAGARVLAALSEAGAEGRTMHELETVSRTTNTGALVDFYVRQGTAIRVGPDRYYGKQSLERVAREALSEIVRLGAATPAQLRDKLGLSRKYLIPLLEWLDLRGFTVREGDSRRIVPPGRAYLDGA